MVRLQEGQAVPAQSMPMLSQSLPGICRSTTVSWIPGSRTFPSSLGLLLYDFMLASAMPALLYAISHNTCSNSFGGSLLEKPEYVGPRCLC